MKRSAFHSVQALVALFCLTLAGSAWAFGGLGGLKVKAPTSSFDTSKVEGLVKELDDTNKTFDDATATFWQATEQFQGVISPYAAGEFPILTRKIEEIRKVQSEAKDDAAKTAALSLRGNYIKEMEARAKHIEGLLQDPAKHADLQGKLKDEDIESLKKVTETLKTTAETDKKVAEKVADISPKVPTAVEELGTQATKDPVKAGDYKKLIDRLNKGNKQLTEIPTEAGRQAKAGDTMTGQITKLIVKAVK
jgi:hypothetical protein